MTNSCLWSHCDWWLEYHWKSAFADWTKKVEGWRSGKSRKTEAKKKIQDLNGVGWSVLGAVTTFGTSGVSILYNLYMVVSYLFQTSNQWYKKLSFLQYKDNSYGHLPIKNTRRHMGVTLLQGLSPPPTQPGSSCNIFPITVLSSSLSEFERLIGMHMTEHFKPIFVGFAFTYRKF